MLKLTERLIRSRETVSVTGVGAASFRRFILALALLALSGCASVPSISRPTLERHIASADEAYRALGNDNILRYNAAVADMARAMERSAPEDFRGALQRLGVSLDLPTSRLPLARFHVVRPKGEGSGTVRLGVPMLIEYDTKDARVHLSWTQA